MHCDDTICAISTPPGEAGMGVIRLSGGQAIAVVDRIFRKLPSGSLAAQPSHTIHYGVIVDPSRRGPLDEVLVSVFRSPRSYTREDMAEIGCHGSPLLLQRLIRILKESGARPAEPGEFTKRAFLNGRLDLSQAEAVMDLIGAKTQAGLKIALEQLQGGLGVQIRNLHDLLTDLLTAIEANIDFSEQGIQEIGPSEILSTLDEASTRIQALLNRWPEGRILREGLTIAIVGRPNVGKSSLLNALLGQDRAIVDETPGTTRDIVAEWANLDGLAVRLLDTAGIRDAKDSVEREGIRRTRLAIEEAGLLLIVLDSSEDLQPSDLLLVDWIRERKKIVILNKEDLPARLDPAAIKEVLPDSPVVQACLAGGLKENPIKGIEKLRDYILKQALGRGPGEAEGVLVVSERQASALQGAAEAIGRARRAQSERMPTECLALELGTAIDQLGLIIGTSIKEDLLDGIFRRFCIGK